MPRRRSSLPNRRRHVEAASNRDPLTGGLEIHDRDARQSLSDCTLLSGFAALYERIGAILSPGEKETLDADAQARGALGNEAFEAAWTEGGALSVEQAVDLSLTVTGAQAADRHAT